MIKKRGPMKKVLAALAIILILTPLSGIETLPGTEQMKAIKEYELPDAEKNNWDIIKSEWMKTEYSACLKKYKLKMNCGGCSCIYMKAMVTINSDGKLSGWKKTGENVCGGKISRELENCFMEPLKKHVYPEILKGTTFEVMLGTGLKC
jgi:hypothetical protein